MLGLLAGLMLIAGGGLTFLAREESDPYRFLGVGGYAVAVGALLLIGYGLAGTAPVWLRLIVCVGLPLLAFSVWQLVTEEIDDHAEGWRGPASAHLIAGIVTLTVGLLLARGATSDEDAYHPTHR